MPAEPAPTRPRILVLGTGGTIAGTAGSTIDRRYAAAALPIGALLAAIADLGLAVDLESRQLAAIGSQDMAAPVWRALYDAIVEAFARDIADAVIVTHGTDTIEETAFLLAAVLPAGRPVVLVGAMRPANAIGADGPRNLANAIRVAADPASCGRGPLVVMGDAVFGARDVRKATTSGADAFRAWPGGALGAVSPSSLAYFAPSRGDAPPPLAFPGEAWPRVEIVHAHADMDAVLIEAAVAAGARGIVLAGVGHGNAAAPSLAALATAARAGVAVVRSTRIDEGAVARALEVDDDALGFVAAGDLSPQKARILLRLLLANGVSAPADLQAAFDRA